jgi:hypothetical protein
MNFDHAAKVSERSVTLCGKPLEGVMHTCAFVDSRDEQYEILAPFMLEGLACNECLVTITSSQHRASHLHRLRRAGIDVEKLTGKGQLLASTFDSTYLQDGCFSPKRMLGMLQALLDGARQAGYGSLRGFGEMDWALSGLPGTEELMEYEAELNILTARFGAPLVCVYDMKQFSGGHILFDVLCTHPKVILSGQIHENPYYVPPDRFMASLSARKKIHEHARSSRDAIRPDAAFQVAQARILARL